MTTQFNVGDRYRIVNYEKDQYLDMEILTREDKWVTVQIGDKQVQARVYDVKNPFSESILLDGYSPVFSYNSIRYEEELDHDEE